MYLNSKPFHWKRCVAAHVLKLSIFHEQFNNNLQKSSCASKYLKFTAPFTEFEPVIDLAFTVLLQRTLDVESTHTGGFAAVDNCKPTHQSKSSSAKAASVQQMG